MKISRVWGRIFVSLRQRLSRELVTTDLNLGWIKPLDHSAESNSEEQEPVIFVSSEVVDLVVHLGRVRPQSSWYGK